jgi:hypothetical protein
MAFKAPDLNEDVSTIAEINANMTLIEDAFNVIQNLLPFASAQRAGQNLGLVDRLLRPDGVIGHQSFDASFGTDFDTFEIFHGAPEGTSACVIDNAFHETSQAFRGRFSDIISSNGDYEVVFGVQTRGSPVVEMHLELQSTDKSQTLTIWEMDVNRNSNLFTVTNLRRVAPVHVNRDSWGRVLDFEHTLTYNFEGQLPALSGPLETGIVIPWPCLVSGAFMRLETPPQGVTDAGDLVMELDYIRGTDATNVLTDQATWTGRDGVGAVKQLNAITPENFMLDAGDYVYPNIVTAESLLTDSPPRASGLSVSLMVKRIYHDVLR